MDAKAQITVIASAQFRDHIHIDKLKSIPLVQEAKTGDMVFENNIVSSSCP